MKIRFLGSKTESVNEENGKPDLLKKQHTPLFYLSLFLLFVLICIGVASVVRLFFLIQKSTFSTSSYSILVASKNPFIAAIDTGSSKLSLISIHGLKKRGRVKESFLLGVPIDGEVKAYSENISKNSFPDITLLVSILVRPWLYSYEDMTLVDMASFTFSSFSVSQKNVLGEFTGVSKAQLYDIFKDPIIINEKVSMEIVNSTAVQGLAGSTGQVLKNIGCNVVSITSADEESTSRIIARNKSVTLTRTSHVLGIPAKIDPNYQGITDMKIVLGKDFEDKVK